MDLTIIAALSENGVIGANQEIPWRISEDFKRFKRLTLDHSIIMGKNTLLSLPNSKPLVERKNIVLSRKDLEQEGVYFTKNEQEALQLTGGNPSYIIGGEEIYRLFLPFANKMELTKVHRNFQGDTFFPEVNWDEWNLTSSEEKMKTKKGLEYSFLTYERITS